MTRTLHHSMQGKPALSGASYLITVRGVIPENYPHELYPCVIVLTAFEQYWRLWIVLALLEQYLRLWIVLTPFVFYCSRELREA